MNINEAETLFSTSRLVVRLLRKADFPSFHLMQSNPNVMQYTTGKAMTEAENEADLNDVISKYSLPNNDFWVWAIVTQSNQKMIGTCAIVPTESEGEMEIGYRLLESEWGKGYGKEITIALISFALENIRMERLVAIVDKENQASVRILEQSSLKFEGEYWNEEMKCTDLKFSLDNSQFKGK